MRFISGTEVAGKIFGKGLLLPESHINFSQLAHATQDA